MGVKIHDINMLSIKNINSLNKHLRLKKSLNWFPVQFERLNFQKFNSESMDSQSSSKGHIFTTKDLPKPLSFEEYDYEVHTLDNGLQLLLISSEKIDKAACAIAVGVGSMSDPEDREGLVSLMTCVYGDVMKDFELGGFVYMVV